jgi:hypothetical protein
VNDFTSFSLELAPVSLEAPIPVDYDNAVARTKSLSTWDMGLTAVVDAARVYAVAPAEMKQALAQRAPMTEIFCTPYFIACSQITWFSGAFRHARLVAPTDGDRATSVPMQSRSWSAAMSAAVQPPHQQGRMFWRPTEDGCRHGIWAMGAELGYWQNFPDRQLCLCGSPVEIFATVTRILKCKFAGRRQLRRPH